MLVLTRKVGEWVAIDNGRILMQLQDVHGSRARLAFKAARDVNITRHDSLTHAEAVYDAEIAPSLRDTGAILDAGNSFPIDRSVCNGGESEASGPETPPR